MFDFSEGGQLNGYLVGQWPMKKADGRQRAAGQRAADSNIEICFQNDIARQKLRRAAK